MKLYDESITSKKKETLSIIDLGYNSVKVSIYDIYKNGHYKKQYQKQEYVKIGSNLFNNGNIISFQNIQRTINALYMFKNDMIKRNVNLVIPIATSAIRDADNGTYVLETLKKQTGFLFNVLSAPQEAFFSYLGSQSAMHMPNGVYFDLGGGSLELIHVQNYKIVKTLCVDLGVLRLYDKFVKYIDTKKTILNRSVDNVIDKEREYTIDFDSLNKYLDKNIPSFNQFSFNELSESSLIAIGGTIRAIRKFISKIFQNPESFSYSHITLDKKMIDLANGIFQKLSAEELYQLKSIDPQRAKTIPIGCFIIKKIMEKLKFNHLFVSPTGLREGVLENYLYFKMDKKYRQRKKFIGLNHEPSLVFSKKFGNSMQYSSLNSMMSLEDSTPFPKKLTITKVSKIKDKNH